MLKLHDYLSSGNGYKVRLLLTQLGIPFERIEHDILQGETRTPGLSEAQPQRSYPRPGVGRRHLSVRVQRDSLLFV